MTSSRRFEQDLPALLDGLYLGGLPDYRDDLLRATAATRQRPAWSFPTRWIPMDVATRRLPLAALPWRTIGVALLILLLAAAALLVAVGAPRRLPPPFGPAANGFIVGSYAGDIVVRDTATGVSRNLIVGPESDSEPGASPDGVRLAFIRTIGADQYLMAAGIDGSNVRQVMASPLVDSWAQWAPDSRHLGVISRVNGRLEFHLVSTEGAPETIADMGTLTPTQFQFRPPDGREIAVRAYGHGGVDLYLMNVDGSNPRELGLHSNGAFGIERDLTGAAWSPTGDRLAYNAIERDGPSRIDHFRVHVLTIATGHDAPYPAPSDPNVHQAWPMWSPDGTMILVQRFTWDEGWFGILPADGSPGAREVGPHVAYGSDSQLDQAWSPDGKTILLRFDDDHFYSIDVATGAQTPLTWPVTKIPDWQRQGS